MLAYALANGAVLVAPAAVLALDSARAEVPPSHGVDLVIGSSALALVHGAATWRWLARITAGAPRSRVVSAYISSLNALVALTLAATGLLIAVLAGFADVHVLLAVAGWPVIALWMGVELIAVILAEVVRRGLFRWIEAGKSRPPPMSVGTAPRWMRPGRRGPRVPVPESDVS